MIEVCLYQFFLTGQPGSGKTYSYDKNNIRTIEPRIVNVDNITEFLNIHNPLSVYDKSKNKQESII